VYPKQWHTTTHKACIPVMHTWLKHIYPLSRNIWRRSSVNFSCVVLPVQLYTASLILHKSKFLETFIWCNISSSWKKSYCIKLILVKSFLRISPLCEIDAHSESCHSLIMPHWMTSTGKEEEMTDQIEHSCSCGEGGTISIHNILWVSRKKIAVANTGLGGEAVNASTLFIYESDLLFLAWIELFTAFSLTFLIIAVCSSRTGRRWCTFPLCSPFYSSLFSFLTQYTFLSYTSAFSFLFCLLMLFSPSKTIRGLCYWFIVEERMETQI